MRHLLGIDDLTIAELNEVLSLGLNWSARKAADEEKGAPERRGVLDGKGVACYFEKPSARTRNSTEMAVVQLGGHPIYITNAEVGIDTRESAEDVTKTLACYHSTICARVFEHTVLERMAALDIVPIVNLLSDQSHPLQAIADVFTMLEVFGESQSGKPSGRLLEGLVVTYVGDANNVARSLAIAVGMLGGEYRIASPVGYQFDPDDLLEIARAGREVSNCSNPAEVVPGSDVIYADTWTSMGQETEHARRLADFAGFQIDDDLMASAGSANYEQGPIFMHCLPAHRGEEVTDDVLDGEQSRIWIQAGHRLTAARSVLAWLQGAIDE